MSEPVTISWEKMEDDQGGYTYRAKVFGGWLVKHVEDVVDVVEGMTQVGYQYRASIAFVPDVNHDWK